MDSEKPIFATIGGNFIRPTWTVMLLFFTLMAVLSIQFATKAVIPRWVILGWTPHHPGGSETGSEDPRSCSGFFREGPKRRVVMSITDFGGVGDGKTSNTETFRRAIRYMQRFGERGGSQLNVPRGRWLTGSFNLTSNFTLYLYHGAVILGSQVRRFFLFNLIYLS